MLINNKNISTFNAKLIDRAFTNHEVVSINEWLEGSPSPIFLRNYERYKELEVQLLVEGATDTAMLANIDKLVQEAKMCVVKFDDLPYYYEAHMEGTANIEKVNSKIHKLTLALMVHSTRGAELSQTANAVASKVFTNTGTLASPAKITIVPTAAIATYTITGLTAQPLVLKNLVSGRTYIVDGYTYRYLSNGASDINNFAGFEFPSVKIGSNTVGFSSTAANVTINYYPKYN